MSTNTYVVKKEQCPMCKKLGKDNSHDNLAVYSDGHKFCFSCKYTEFPNKITAFKNKEVYDHIDFSAPHLPIDCDIVYPQRALEWIYQYDLTKEDLLKYNVMWSESLQRLIFPVFGDGFLIAWQGRSFYLDSELQKKYPKWYGKGNLKDTLNIMGTGSTLVLTEDVVSAIKVSKCGVRAMPLYGCNVGDRFKLIKTQVKHGESVLVWLDPDKRKEGLLEAHRGRIYGLNCRAIISSNDPKEHSYDEIKEKLNE